MLQAVLFRSEFDHGPGLSHVTAEEEAFSPKRALVFYHVLKGEIESVYAETVSHREPVPHDEVAVSQEIRMLRLGGYVTDATGEVAIVER